MKCPHMFNFVRTVPRLHVEQADKQTPEVRSSDLVAIGRGNSSAKAEVPAYYSVQSCMYMHSLYMPLCEG